MRNTNRKNKTHTDNKPFYPIEYALKRIQAFDERAHIAFNKELNQRVVRYALYDGGRITLGKPHTSVLVNKRQLLEFTEAQAKQMCKELGVM